MVDQVCGSLPILWHVCTHPLANTHLYQMIGSMFCHWYSWEYSVITTNLYISNVLYWVARKQTYLNSEVICQSQTSINCQVIPSALHSSTQTILSIRTVMAGNAPTHQLVNRKNFSPPIFLTILHLNLFLLSGTGTSLPWLPIYISNASLKIVQEIVASVINCGYS